jgi:hypothetical protein
MESAGRITLTSGETFAAATLINELHRPGFVTMPLRKRYRALYQQDRLKMDLFCLRLRYCDVDPVYTRRIASAWQR